MCPKVMIIPLLAIRSLKLTNHRERYAFFFVYLVGGMSVIAACIRYALLVVHLDKSLDLNYNESDSGMMSTYKAYGYMHRMEKIKMWALLEWCMATTAFCLPSLRSSLKTKSKQKGVEEISSTGLETYISTVEGRVDRQN